MVNPYKLRLFWSSKDQQFQHFLATIYCVNNLIKHYKKAQKSRETKEFDIDIRANADSKDKSIKKADENEEVVFADKKDEIELTDAINNARKKRRRSSASIE